MSAFNDLSYFDNNGLQHLNDRLHNTFRVTAGQTDYANLGNHATSSGHSTNANGDYSYAEGYFTSSIGSFSHSEGLFANAIGSYSHAEGQSTYSNGMASHAEGYNTRSFGNYSHAEGNNSLANADYSHAEGGATTASGLYSHAEGSETTAVGHSAHSEGALTRSGGTGAHSEGYRTRANASGAHSEGSSAGASSSTAGIYAGGVGSHAEGNTGLATSFILATGTGSHAEGYTEDDGDGTLASGTGSHAEGSSTKANGAYSHAEGRKSVADGKQSHAEGYYTNANGVASHVEGYYTSAFGYSAHAEGYYAAANGKAAHAEGTNSSALAEDSHAEGHYSVANGVYSHAEGYRTFANYEASHAEGYYTNAIGAYSHAEGRSTQALREGSHASGSGTIANSPYATVVGKYSNDSQDILFGVGNGNDAENRSSCFEITTDGYMRMGSTKIRFGVDANGNYGYIKPGADTVYPFKSDSSNEKNPVKAKALAFLCTRQLKLSNDSLNFVTSGGIKYLQVTASSPSIPYQYPYFNNDPLPYLQNVMNSDSNFFVAIKVTFIVHTPAISDSSFKILKNINNAYLISDINNSNYYYISNFLNSKQDYKPAICFNTAPFGGQIFKWRGKSDNNSAISSYNSYYYHYIGYGYNESYPKVVLFNNNSLTNSILISDLAYKEGQDFLKNNFIDLNCFFGQEYVVNSFNYTSFNGNSNINVVNNAVKSMTNFMNYMQYSNNGSSLYSDPRFRGEIFNDYFSSYDPFSFLLLYNFKAPFLNYYINSFFKNLEGPRYSWLFDNGFTNLYLDAAFSHFQIAQTPYIGANIVFSNQYTANAKSLYPGIGVNAGEIFINSVFGIWDD